MAAPRYQLPLSFDEPVLHHAMLHRSPHGAVLVWEALAESGKRWKKISPGDQSDEVEIFLARLEGKTDTYISVNEFDGWRMVRLLRSLRSCYVDIDLGREATHYDLDEAREALLGAGIPNPSIVVFSGRGLHLYWLLQATPAKALPVWQRIQDTILKALKHVGADGACRDCTRVLRLAGTINSKTGTAARGLVLDGVPWTLHHLANEVLGERQAKPATVRSLSARRAKTGIKPNMGASIYARWHLVMLDLHRIGAYWQTRGGIPEGNRDKFLFLSSVALSWFSAPDAITAEVQDVASLYVPGVTNSDMAKAAQESYERAEKARAGEKMTWNGQERDPRYAFRRETLWQWLEAVASPLQNELRAIIPDRLAKERKSERDSARYADHYTGKGVRAGNEQKRATARLLVAQGKSQREIAAELGVAQKTVSAWLRNDTKRCLVSAG